MKKASLEQIPFPRYPRSLKKPEGFQRFHTPAVTARTMTVDGEELLELTGFHMDIKEPAWRVFIHQEGNKYRTQELGENPCWSQKRLGALIYGTSSCYYYGVNIDDYRITKADTTRICKYFSYKSNWHSQNPLDLAAAFQREIGREKRERQRNRIQEVFDYVDSTLPALPQDIDRFVQDTCMPESRYIFYSPKDRHGWRTGWCTSCGTEVQIDYDVEHNRPDQCPNCCEQAIHKAAGRGRSRLQDRCAFSIAQKGREPHELIIRYFEVERDYSGDPKHIRNKYMESARYYLNAQDHKAYLWKQQWGYFWYGYWIRCERDDELRPRGFFHSREFAPPAFPRLNRNNMSYSVHHYPLTSAIAGTAFTHSGYDLYKKQRGERSAAPAAYLAEYTKHPCIEYMVKNGFTNLVGEKLNGWPGSLNWSGRDAQEIFGLPLEDIRVLRKLNPDGNTVALYTWLRSRNKGISRQELEFLTAAGAKQEDTRKILSLLSPARAVNYIRKQIAEAGGQGGPPHQPAITPGMVIHDWADYLDDLKELGLPYTSENLRPANLYEAHGRIIAQREDRDNPELNIQLRKLAKRYNKLYSYSGNGLSIRAAWSCGELIAEGKVLSHCVSRYAQRVADKQCAILLIRRDDAPDVPFYTLELKWEDKKQKHPVAGQCRGYKNCSPTSEVQAFLERWKEARLEHPEDRSQTQPAAAVAVAV